MDDQQELQIAIALAKIIEGADYSTILDVESEEENQWGGFVSCQLSAKESMYAKANRMTSELAMSRAQQTGRDFRTVLEETEEKIRILLAKIFAKTIHPALQVLSNAVVDEEKKEVCGICQEEMKAEDDVRAMDCMHRYHCECIFKWLNKKMVCPLCRYCPVLEDHIKAAVA